jgi:outer membrane lipoprotein-sorting protein
MSEVGDLLELLHGARHRYRTVRLAMRTWGHVERSRRAFEQGRERACAWTAYGMISVSAGGLGRDADRPETQEHVVRLWLEQGGRVREEADRDGDTRIVVQDGATWWMYSERLGAMTNSGDPNHHAGAGDQARWLLDPSELIPRLDLEPVGRRSVAGRAGIVVQAVSREGDEHLTQLGLRLMGADGLELVVDVERGVVLRLAALIDGDEYLVEELQEISFDEDFPATTFAIELPAGETFRSVVADMPERLALDEAARLAGFVLWVPGRLAADWDLVFATHMPGSERPRSSETVHLTYAHAQAGRGISQSARRCSPTRGSTTPSCRRSSGTAQSCGSSSLKRTITRCPATSWSKETGRMSISARRSCPWRS